MSCILASVNALVNKGDYYGCEAIVQIFVQKTVSTTYNGHYNSFSTGIVTSSYVDSGTQIVYKWTIDSVLDKFDFNEYDV